MEAPKSDAPKLSNMIMSGDHPSFTKPAVGVKDAKMEDKEKEKPKEKTMSYARISPSSSRTERGDRGERGERGERAERAERASSEHALRLLEARRRAVADMQRSEMDGPAIGNRALVQAALGSFRWPPYLLAVWVMVLVITHVLHCLVNMLERALPPLKKCCQYFRTWTEESWKGDPEINQRVCPVALACVTGTLYALYFCLYGLFAIALWSIEPLCSELDEKRSVTDVEARVTNYIDDVHSNTNASFKQ